MTNNEENTTRETGGFAPGGQISDRLKAQFPDEDRGWDPGREAKPPVSKEALKRHEGFSAGEGSNRARIHGRGANKKK